MSGDTIRIIGDELWFQGMKIGTLHKTGYPSIDAAVRKHLTDRLAGKDVRGWPA